ncbi:homoserine dehydrogenase [Candidatus Sumerlaeota bacterium]|nr:homoserine dehydrogenase [Candidatus Sumerlaeota bacterium]
MSTFRLALVGFGNIGSGLVKHIIEKKDLLAQRAGVPIELTWIADKEFEKPRGVTPPTSAKLTTNWREAVTAANVDAVVELVGVGADGKPTLAADIARAALSAGKHFITANKGLIAAHGGELHELAAKNGVLLLFEASVGAGIPIISSLQTGLAPDRITAIHGIVNGTCNYILTQLDSDSSLTMQKAIADAQALGYAEPDPRFDVEGNDTAYKLVILASLAFGQELSVDDVSLDGITKLGPEEGAYAKANGLAVKLLASAAQLADGSASLVVGPAFIPATHVLAGVRDVFNAVLVEADPIGQTMYFGRGAGQGSTGSGLLADAIFAAKLQKAGSPDPQPLRIPRGMRKPADPNAVEHRFYIRVRTEGDSAKADQAAALIGGRKIGPGGATQAFLVERISLSALDKLLGKLSAAGFPDGAICKVRFALGTT